MVRMALIIALLGGSAGYVPKNDLVLTITIYAIDSRKLWTYVLDTRRISVTRHFTRGEPDRVLLERPLTLQEIKKLDRFLGRYPFDSLEKYYINERIHGSTGTVYHIRINRKGKDSYVFYARPESLLELNRFINRLLPRQFHLWDDVQ
ncbi:MAG: hypothetical protein KA369_00520 [Spirochaetes bacterium]|nr:hypothetical protein [Spirochaetota bacterium]